MQVTITRTTLPVIDVAGDHRTIGNAIGEALRDGLQAVTESHRAGVERDLGWARAMDLAATLLPQAEAAMPHCVAELRGMAGGSGVPFETLFSMNALQETRFLIRAADGAGEDDEGCTSLAVSGTATAGGGTLLAHNEDAGTIRRALPYVVRARPTDRPAFVGFAYSGLLLYQGLNDRGIGSVGNALSFRDIRPGTPKLLAYRDVLDATFLEDAIRRTQRAGRANGNNHLVANADGDIYDIEVSATRAALIPGRDMLAHTNHATDDAMRELEWGDHLNSRMRLHRVETLLDRGRGRHDADSLFAILSDHSNYPKSVCKHHDVEVNPDVQTVASVVVDLDAGLLHVRPGHPCDTETTTVALG